jgi:hydroxymethylpyrimidine/phosphomethylpyrimidine kinase
MGAAAVVITGGHPIGEVYEDDVVDLLFDGGSFIELKTARVRTDRGHPLHGTGCTFASALAAGLALGEPLATAAGRAQQYVAGAMTHRLAIGHGAFVLDHFWRTRSA